MVQIQRGRNPTSRIIGQSWCAYQDSASDKGNDSKPPQVFHFALNLHNALSLFQHLD
jgi:hypothetical protein